MTATAVCLANLRRVIKLREGVDRAFALRIEALSIASGQALALVGPSGCGKSTLIDVLALALRPDGGDVFTVATGVGSLGNDGYADILDLWRTRERDRLAALRARMFGYVLQTGGLLPFLSVADNIALPQRLAGRRDPARINNLAERLGVTELLGDLPGRLSVGQRQRVAIARALAHRPPIVLADEPTASLDPINAGAVFDLFLELIRDDGIALVVATHDRTLVDAHGLQVIDASVRRDGRLSVTVFDDGSGPEGSPAADGADELADRPLTGIGTAADPLAAAS